MDLRSLSFPEAPLIRVEPPGPLSREYLRIPEGPREQRRILHRAGCPWPSAAAAGRRSRTWTATSTSIFSAAPGS